MMQSGKLLHTLIRWFSFILVFMFIMVDFNKSVVLQESLVGLALNNTPDI